MRSESTDADNRCLLIRTCYQNATILPHAGSGGLPESQTSQAPEAIHRSMNSTSEMDCHRSEGSFMRQRATRKSSAAGIPETNCEIAGELSFRMEAVRLACLVP